MTKLFIKSKYSLLIIISGLFCISWLSTGNMWFTKNFRDYKIVYTSVDKNNINDYNEFVENGIFTVNTFFNSSFKSGFDIIIHPNRLSLDSSWRKDWNMPEFKSDCWMVASGISNKLDVLSPKHWNTEACEHVYSEAIKTQQLITHELVHVFHGQRNISGDFSDTDGIDWFVEGLATYASGQCDSTRLDEIKKAIEANQIPTSLDAFWTGKIKYGLSGSIVMFIDHKYGRAKLKELLSVNKNSEILSILKISEPELLNGWRVYIQKL